MSRPLSGAWVAIWVICAACPARAGRVDDYVKAQMAKERIPGVSVGVVRDGKVVLAKGYGMANVELSVPATPDTVYELLSVTKQFTAAAILMLVEEGKIGLDDPIAKHLPNTPAAWSPVTVRHLLTHTSGITDYTDVPGWFKTIRLDRSPEDLLEPVKALPLGFQPGDRWRYSNAGYYLLGMILEKVSGKSYAEFLQARIFKPLQMTSTRVNSMTALVPHRASGYHIGAVPWRPADPGEADRVQNAEYVSPTQKWAAGAVVSTVTDLAKWDAALYTEKLLKKTTLRQMWTPARLNNGAEAPYGFGNELDMEYGHRVAGHQGGGMAFNATLLRFPDDRLTVIVLCNLTQAPSRPMARRIASFYLPFLAVEAHRGMQDDDPGTTRMLKSLLLDAAEGKVDASLFAPDAQTETVPFIRRAGPGFLKPLGAMKSFVLLERRDEKERRLYRYRAVYQDSSVVWTFTLTPEGKISSLRPTRE
jgi:D-alanyl-D-alanine carboxypeptidase